MDDLYHYDRESRDLLRQSIGRYAVVRMIGHKESLKGIVNVLGDEIYIGKDVLKEERTINFLHF